MDAEQHNAYASRFRRKGKVAVQTDDVQDFKDWLDNLKVAYTTEEKEGVTIFIKEGRVP